LAANHQATLEDKVALVTGAARRIGASVASSLHAAGARVAIHYRDSGDEARELQQALLEARPDSAATFRADLTRHEELSSLVEAVVEWAGGLDVLVNNASSFYPTPLGHISVGDWDDLVGTNLKAPLFLAQAAWPELRRHRGCIVNMIDVHARRPLRNYPVYGSAKAGLAMLTRSLAKDMAPEVRVNGVAPGAILWPEAGLTDAAKASILRQIPLARAGDPADIAGCVLYLVRDASYVTGQIIAVDGGRSIGW
jgi:pteridine reductase